MAILSNNQKPRKNIPKSRVRLLSKITRKGGAVASSYPMPDKMLGKGPMVAAALKKRIGK